MELSDMFSFNKQRQEPGDGQETNPDSMEEIGVAGARVSSGFVHDEFLNNLTGDRGRRVYREMRDNDDTVGAIMFAIEMLFKAVNWEVKSDLLEGGSVDQSGGGSGEGETLDDINSPKGAIKFVEGVLFKDMDNTFDETIDMILTELTFGWQYSEIVWKRRDGIKDYDDKQPSSNFEDGLIGIHKLADRSQETLDRWDRDDHGKVYGMWQQPPSGVLSAKPYIPMGKALLFRVKNNKDSPEGRSLLRNAYRSWYFLKRIQEIEAIGIERELNGLPIASIPDAILNGKTDAARAAKARYEKLVRDIKFNEQGGVVIPSDPWYDAEGNPTNMKQVTLELLSTNGTRAIDTDKVIRRYQAGIARSILADFIMLGQTERGSFALSKDKSDLFLRAAEGILESIASVFNRSLLPKLWKINGLNPEFIPKLVPGNISPIDIRELGEYIKSLTGSGFLLNDSETEQYLREAGGLPEGNPTDEDLLTFDDDPTVNNED